MRELILARIEKICKIENGFTTSVTRWRNFTHGTENKHLKDIKFEELNDTELLFLLRG